MIPLHFMKLLPIALLIVLVGCRGKSNTQDAGTDAGEEEMVEYEGDSTGAPPDFAGEIIDAGNKSEIDAGQAELDTRCCKLNFRIDFGDEPTDAVATLAGQVEPLSNGIPLTKTDAGYVASACFPMVSSTFYSYQFEWVSSDSSLGGLDLGDGGFLITRRRHSTYETSYPAGDGTHQNYIPAVTDCATLDAGMGP